MTYRINYAYTCHAGKVRSNNEDNFWCCGEILPSQNLGMQEVRGGERLRERATAGNAQRCEHAAEHQPDCCGKHGLSPPQKAYVRPASPDSGLQIFRDMV